MKLTVLLLTAFTVQVTANSFAQKVTLSEEKSSIIRVLKLIKTQTGYDYLMIKKAATMALPVSINVKNINLNEALYQIFKGQPLSYELKNKTILIYNKVLTDQTPAVFSILNRERYVHGRVVDETNRALPGVTVRMKKDLRSLTATDVRGQFQIRIEDEADVMEFSIVGFVSQEINLPTDRSMDVNVVMRGAVGSLEEVQVIGYGVSTRKLNTGSVGSVASGTISKQSIDNPLTALQGRIAGLQITQNNGLPGSSLQVQIRGINSLTAGSSPLYVVDGVPFSSSALNEAGSSGANGSISPFSVINPQDVERIDVLKDADATAIYGSRGTNGVILITTKKGSMGQTRLNVNAFQGYSEVNRYIPMMNTQEYLSMRKAAFVKAGVTPTAANAPDLMVWDQNAYTDWQKWAIGGTSRTTDANVSLSGGDQQNTFLFAGTYRDQGTVFPGDYGAETLSARTNMRHKSLNGRFGINLSVNYTSMNNNQPLTDLSSVYNLAPNFPLNKADGSLNWSGFSAGVFENPLASLLKKYNSKTRSLISNLTFDYKILDGLTFKANLGYNLANLKQLVQNPANSQNLGTSPTTAAKATANRMSIANNDNSNYIVEPQIEYKKELGPGNLQVLIGGTFQQNKTDGTYLSGSNFSNENLLESISNAGTVVVNNAGYSLYKYTAIFGRVNYNLKDKYILDATFRRDGSSRFGPNKRFGNFGAVGAAWIFSSEDFVKNLNLFSFGKLRASFGGTGNDQIGNYLYESLYQTGYYPYLGTSNLIQYNYANENLHWETTKKLNLGIELGFFNNRLSLNADYYRNRSSNQLLSINLPGQTGFTSYTGNFPAIVQNQGLEMELNSLNVESGLFKWNTSLNVTFNSNKLVAFPDLTTSSYSTTYLIGRPIDIVQLYHYTGVNPATGQPMVRDQNGDGVIDYTNDRIPMKVGTPYYGGISNTISYKDFSLEFSFQFNHRFGYLNNTLTNNFYPYGYTTTNQTTAILNRWMQPGDTQAQFPSASTAFSNDYVLLYQSDYNWGDASYIKFRTLGLNYSLPKDFLSKIKLNSARVYVQGQNLYTWAKQKYVYDPETTAIGSGNGIGTGRFVSFPQLRTFIVGLNLSF